MGDGVGVLTSSAVVNDGNWHNIEWVHQDRLVLLKVDNQIHNATRIDGRMTQWNIDHLVRRIDISQWMGYFWKQFHYFQVTIGAAIDAQSSLAIFRHIILPSWS